jgi:hypothetical protein
MAEGLQTLQTTVTSGNPWGQDEQGSLFGLAYTEVLQHAIDVYDSHVDMLMTAAGNLTDWGQQLRDTEEENKGLFQRLLDMLGG